MAELRAKLISAFNALPLDQHIFHCGRELTAGSSAMTLGALGVRPDDELDLEVSVHVVCVSRE